MCGAAFIPIPVQHSSHGRELRFARALSLSSLLLQLPCVEGSDEQLPLHTRNSESKKMAPKQPGMAEAVLFLGRHPAPEQFPQCTEVGCAYSQSH